MKIACPITNAEEVEELAKAGAGEFYLGYVSPKWERKYSYLASPNRRYFKESSFRNMSEVAAVVKKANKFGIPVYLAVNGPFYIKKQYPLLLKDIGDAVKAGVHSIIIADLPLMLLVKQKFPLIKITVSTVACSLNSASLEFYKKLGAGRIILPRHLTFEEIKKIRKNTDLELETFMLFDWCKNLDGLCTFHHGMEKCLGREHGCVYANQYQLVNSENLPSTKIKIINNRMKNIKFNNFCGACYLTQFEELGINSVKMAGRRFPTSMKVRSLQFLKNSFHNDPCMEYFNTFHQRCPKICNAYGKSNLH